MKKIVFSSILLGTIGLFAQEISCVEFASMSDSEANRYITQFKNEITVIGNDDNKDSKNIVRKNYLKDNSKVAHRHKCLLLRKASKSPVTNLKRVKALSHLSKEQLSSSENKLYTQLVRENTQYLSGLKGASLVQSDLCVYPLLYLASESTSKGLLIYEKRLVDKKIKTFHAYIDKRKVQLACGSRADIGNRYLNYLNQQGANLPLIHTDIYSNDFSHSNHLEEVQTNSRTFKVNSDFKAVNFVTNQNKQIKQGVNVVYDKSTNSETFFFYKDIKYRAIKNVFSKSVNK